MAVAARQESYFLWLLSADDSFPQPKSCFWHLPSAEEILMNPIVRKKKKQKLKVK